MYSSAILAQSLDKKIFKIQSADPNSKGKFLDADGLTLGQNATKIQLWDGNNEPHQNWMFVKFTYMGAKNLYHILNMSTKAGEYNYLSPSAENIGKNGAKGMSETFFSQVWR